MSSTISQTETLGPHVEEPGIYAYQRLIDNFQGLFFLVARILIALMRRRYDSVFTAQDVRPGVRYVMAANHQSMLDSFIVPSSIPLSLWRRMGMPREFVANKFFSSPLVAALLKLCGCFPAYQHPTDPYGLNYAFHHMSRGRSILIYPEGARTLQGGRPARNGVKVLASQPNTMIIPARIQWHRAKFFRWCSLSIGKPFDGSKMTAQEILDHIYSLPLK
jgi:1-acyl-sn-glycerol-3-phosphate acyltransferase